MADITLTVDVSSLADAKKKIKDFSNEAKNINVNSLVSSVQGLQGKIKQLADAQKSGTINSKTYNLGLLEIKRAYEQLGYSSQKATQMVRAYAAELQRQEAARQAAEAARQLARAQEEAALSAKRAADRIQELRMRFQEGYAANQRYRQSVNDLKEAYRAGLIPSLDVYKQKLRELRAAQGQVLGNIRGQGGLGVAIQQVGYQVGDFVVQVQSGTSAFVAFGQQATQLVGILPLVHRQLGLTAMQAIGLSTGLGIIIPIATAIGRYFWELSGESKKLADRFSDLSDASGKLSDLFNILESTNLEETYGSLTPQVRELAESFIELNTAGELNSLLSTLDKLKKETESPWWKSLLASVNVGANLGPMAGMTALINSRINPTQVNEFLNEEEFKKYGFNLGRDVYLDLVDGMIAEAKSGDKSGVLEAFQELVNKATSGDVSNISLLGQTTLNDLREALTKIAENAAKLDGSAKAVEESNKAAEEAAKATAKALKNAADEADRQAKAIQKVNDLHTELGRKLDEETVKYLEAQGHERQALALRKQIAYERARDEVLAQAATAQQAIDLAASADLAGQAAEEAVQMAYETERAKDAAKGFADNLRDAASAMSSLTSLGSSIERALAVSQAKVTALKNKADGAVASTVAGYRFDIRARTDEAINKAAAAGLSPSAAIAEGARQMSSVTELEKSLTQGASLSKENRSSGSSGSKKEQEDYLASLLKEAEYKKSIIGLSEQEARQKEIIFELTEKGLPIEDARIKKVLEAEEALRRATEAEDKRKNMIDNISNKMEEAFMSMIDGSKSVGDAFKGMIREILIDIYRQQVVNPMVKGIMGLLGGIGGLGGAPTSSIRPKPRPFANGGVVSRATMFPMANGSTGLMGEAGPEAIMPLKRGKDGKLGVQMNGGSGTVVVNQSFNFSANGDESVKKIIAQAAPQIAMMTQQQIMDSRRRGGSMKATFG